MGDHFIEKVLVWYGVLIVSLVFHEASHALLAKLGGDLTAYLGGQVTLNPVPHMKREPFGTIILPLAVLFMSKGNACMGFAHAPVSARWAERHPKRAAVMSAAGPLSNLMLAAIGFGVLKLLLAYDFASPYPLSHLGFSLPISAVDPDHSWVTAAILLAWVFVFLNVVLAILNLIPWPPLDGAGVIAGFFPAAEKIYGPVRRNTVLLILGLVGVWYLLPSLYLPAVRALYHAV